MRKAWRRVVVLALHLGMTGCVTEQLARVSETDDAPPAIAHCLTSLGFWTDGELLADFRRGNPDLLAVWRAQSRGRSNAPGTIVWVESRRGEFQLRFVPGVGEDNSGTAVLAQSFKHCIPEHAADAKVTLTSRTSPELR